MRAALAAVLGLALAGPAWAAEVVSPGPEQTAVAIYRAFADSAVNIGNLDHEGQGVAMIRETRTLDLPQGRSKISFRGVADGVMARTAKLEGLPGRLVEQNFDYDLLTPAALIAKSVGERVTVVRTDRARGEVTEQRAILRSGADGVVLEIDGALEALRCSGLPERIVFDRAPAGLTDTPTLSLVADVPRAGRYTVTLSYLATGFDWGAAYVARVRPDGRTLDLSGWITLANKSQTGFADAKTEVVGGSWNRVEWEQKVAPPPPVPLRCWPLGSGREGVALRDKVEELTVTGSRIARPNLTSVSPVTAVQTDLGDYKLYTLPHRTSVAARQIKQVAFLGQRGVRFERLYGYDVEMYVIDDGPERVGLPSAVVVLRLQNTASARLGKALPAGSFALMETGPGGTAVFAGGTMIEDDVPVGRTIDLRVSGAPDVRVQPRLLTNEHIQRDNRSWRRGDVEVTVFNGKPVPIRFELRQGEASEDIRILSSSRRHVLKDGRITWPLALKPGASQTVRYTIEWGF